MVHIQFKIKRYIFSMSITACIHCNTDSWFDVTLTAKKSTKIKFSNDMQDILQFLSEGSKYYKYVNSSTMIYAL